MEFLIVSCLFFIYAIYLFSTTKHDSVSQISEEDAESYFFGKSEVTKDRKITYATRTNGIGFYKNKEGEIEVIKQSKLCGDAIW